MRKKGKLSNPVVPYTILAIMGILFALPLLWIILASFDQNANQALAWPDWTVQNYVDILTDSANQRSFGNGLFISLIQTALVVIISGLCAYPLSRYEMKNKDLFMYTILFMTSLPVTSLMVPVYQMFLAMSLYDNLWGVIIFMTASALPYAIWLMKNFMDTVSIELEEAAWIDGASTIKSIVRIVIPLMMPGICTVAIFTFSGSWGNFFVPYILLQSAGNLPPSIKLYQFFGNYGMVQYGQLAAYSTIYALPSIVLYILAQKFMSQGFTMSGANKG